MGSISNLLVAKALNGHPVNIQEVERRGTDAVNKVKIQNDNLERGKQQLEQQLNTLHGELQKQQDIMKRLGMLCTLLYCTNVTHPLYTPPIPPRQCRVNFE